MSSELFVWVNDAVDQMKFIKFFFIEFRGSDGTHVFFISDNGSLFFYSLQFSFFFFLLKFKYFILISTIFYHCGIFAADNWIVFPLFVRQLPRLLILTNLILILKFEHRWFFVLCLTKRGSGVLGTDELVWLDLFAVID